jgi:hypothetical protein
VEVIVGSGCNQIQNPEMGLEKRTASGKAAARFYWALLHNNQPPEYWRRWIWSMSTQLSVEKKAPGTVHTGSGVSGGPTLIS